MDSKSLEYHCGVTKVRDDLEMMSKKLALVRDNASYERSYSSGASTGSSKQERERFDQTVRSRAMKEFRRREHEIAVELKKEYQPYLDADVQTIKEFPEAIGSPKTKRQLIKSTYNTLHNSLFASLYLLTLKTPSEKRDI